MYADEVLADSPAVYLRLNEPTPGTGTAADLSGNGRNGTYVGSPVTARGIVPCDEDRAVDFSGTGQGVSSTYSPFTTGASLTLECWYLRDSQAASQALIANDTGTGNQVLIRAVSGGTDISFFSDAGVGEVTWTAAGVAVGRVGHLALTYVDTTKTSELYVNGVSQGTKVSTNAFTRNGTYTVGYYGGLNEPFDGRIDEVAIYLTALSAGRVQAHYDAGTRWLTRPPTRMPLGV